jgi:hypothetical protein
MVNLNKVSSAIQGSLVNLITGDVPNFQRSTCVWLEHYPNGSLRLEPVSAFQPAINSEDAAIILEPAGVNYVTYNTDLTQGIWLKGSRCNILPDEVESPDATTYQADIITWTTGEGLSQSLKRTFILDAGKEYTMSLFISLPGRQQAATKDVIRVNSGVVGTPTIKLSELNATPSRYRILELRFTTNGRQIELPKYSHTTSYNVASVAATAINISVAAAINSNQFAGGRVQFEGNTKLYNILGNTASSTLVSITLDVVNLGTEGIVPGVKATIHGASGQEVEIEFYVESTLSLYFGGIQIEQRPFRTSMIYQDGAYKVRSKSLLYYRKNFIANLKTFSIFLELNEWRGDGNLFDAGNLKATIVSGKLVVEIDGNILSASQMLPTQCKIFIQVSEENTNLSIYINKILLIRTNIYNFVGDHNSLFILTSEGYRAILQLLVFDQILLDGQNNIGSAANNEVAELFDAEVILDAKILSANTPPIVLPPVLVPPPPSAIAKSQIQGINTTNNTVTVTDGTNFVTNQGVSVVRGGNKIVLSTKILVKTGNALQLETMYGLILGDILVYGNASQPGVASVRFPYTPIEQLAILAVDATTARVTVSSSLSFVRATAFISTVDYQDIAEVKIINKDDTRGYLFLSTIQNIQVGYLIAQAKNELIVDPSCYRAFFLDEIPGVEIDSKFSNGLRLINKNSVPVTIQPAIDVCAY